MTEGLVFDTGPLSHFAEAGWLRILETLTEGRQVYIPELVHDEIRSGCHTHPFLAQLLDADWIRVDRSDDLELLVVIGRYADRLVSGGKNRGECGVLALAEVRGLTAVIDDRVARHVGAEYGVRVTGTLALLREGIAAGLLTMPLVARIADHLITTEYRLPFGPGGFEIWAREQGWLAPDVLPEQP